VAFFCFQNVTSAGFDLHQTLSTRTATAARRRYENLGFCQRVHQFATGRDSDFFLPVDHDFDFALGNQRLACHQDQSHQSHDDCGEECNASKN